jgi:hypothetical protein
MLAFQADGLIDMHTNPLCSGNQRDLKKSMRLLAFVRQSTTGSVGAGDVDGPAAFLDVGDLAVFVYDEGRAVGNAHLHAYTTVVSSKREETAYA